MNNEYMNLLPVGAIIMWAGSYKEIPYGWTLCDGDNGTPNMTERFVVGATGNYPYKKGEAGGEAFVQLKKSQMPSHTHNVNASTSESGDHYHTVTITTNRSEVRHKYASGNANTTSPRNVSNKNWDLSSSSLYKNGKHSHRVSSYPTIYNEGGNQPHENRPNYYALYFIMKIEV